MKQPSQLLLEQGWSTWGEAGPSPGPSLLWSCGVGPGKPSQGCPATKWSQPQAEKQAVRAVDGGGPGDRILVWWEDWLMAKPPGSLGKQPGPPAQARWPSQASGGGTEAQVESGYLAHGHGFSPGLRRKRGL